MKIRVKLYSIFRDVSGKSEIEIEVERGSFEEVVGELMKREDLSRAFEALGDSFLVIDGNGERLERGGFTRSDTLHLMPLPSGGELHKIVRVLGEGDDVDVDKLIEELSKLGVGAITLFIGVVKPENEGERVEELVYEFSPELLEKSLDKIAREVGDKWGLRGIAILHYTGRRKPGDRTIVIAAAGLSRKNTIPALAEALERVKHEAPVFKTEIRESGRFYIVGEKSVKAPA